MLRAKRVWRERQAPADIIAGLEQELGLSHLAARLLALRGVHDPEHAQRFLRKRLADLHPPELLRDLPLAAARLAKALSQRERILIHGDYDVDGSTSATLLKLFCRACGHDAVAWIPDRRIDGYGLSEASLVAVRTHQAQVMITVDCGIADGGWAERIEQETGCAVLITDHHLPQNSLPRCTAVCNPNHPDCSYPDKGLAGVGVAWKLAWATARELSGGAKVSDRLRSFLLDSLALVAIGTVADCAPLDGENRILVHHGLQALERTTNPGLRALLNQARLDGRIMAGDIGWRLGPLLNASGRLGSALRNVELLTAETSAEAEHILAGIVEDNEERRRITQALTDSLFEEVDSNPAYQDRHSLVFAGDGWHAGVVGIVASRLVERYGKPAVVIAINDGLGKGSLRTTPQVHLGHAIDACRPLLLAGGGHAMAAGLTVVADRVPAFIQAFEEHIRSLQPGGLPTLGTQYDAIAQVKELSESFFAELESLAPFGTANPQPVIQVQHCRFAGRPEAFGKGGNHLRGALTDDGGGLQQLIAWSLGQEIGELIQGRNFHLLLQPELSFWRGRAQPRLLWIDGSAA